MVPRPASWTLRNSSIYATIFRSGRKYTIWPLVVQGPWAAGKSPGTFEAFRGLLVSSEATQMREETWVLTASSALWSGWSVFQAFRTLDRDGTGQIQVDTQEGLQLSMYS